MNTKLQTIILPDGTRIITDGTAIPGDNPYIR
jgi:hypothetical protein